MLEIRQIAESLKTDGVDGLRKDYILQIGVSFEGPSLNAANGIGLAMGVFHRLRNQQTLLVVRIVMHPTIACRLSGNAGDTHEPRPLAVIAVPDLHTFGVKVRPGIIIQVPFVIDGELILLFRSHLTHFSKLAPYRVCLVGVERIFRHQHRDVALADTLEDAGVAVHGCRTLQADSLQTCAVGKHTCSQLRHALVAANIAQCSYTVKDLTASGNVQVTTQHKAVQRGVREAVLARLAVVGQ